MIGSCYNVRHIVRRIHMIHIKVKENNAGGGNDREAKILRRLGRAENGHFHFMGGMQGASGRLSECKI